MIACVDVGYQTKSALAACAVITDWSDCDPVTTHTLEIDQVEEYVPGEFYKRELPCILQVLRELTIRRLVLWSTDSSGLMPIKRKAWSPLVR